MSRTKVMEEGLLDGANSGESAAAAETNTASSATPILLLSTFVAVCGSFAYGCSLGYVSPAESGIINDLGLSTAEYSLYSSLSTFGGMLGALISGWIADLVGRRGAMWFFELCCIIGWLAIIFAQDVWLLDLARFAIGFGFGINSYVSTIYVAEITPKDTRGGFAMTNQLMVCGGITLMFLVGNFFTWRYLAVLGSIPCLVQIFGVFFIPESPRWLAEFGLEKDMEATLQWLRGRRTNITREAAEIKNVTRNFQQPSGLRLLEPLQQKYARLLIIGIGIMILVPLGGNNAILFYAKSIFEAAGSSASIGTTAIAFSQIPCSVVGLLLADVLGRRLILMVTLAGTCLGSFLVALGFLMQGKGLTPTLVLAGMLIYFAFLAIGLPGLPSIILSEIIPIHIKGRVGSIATFFGFMGSWIVIYAFDFFFIWSSAGVFLVFTTIGALTMLFVAKMLPETSGRSLEEIHSSLIQ